MQSIYLNLNKMDEKQIMLISRGRLGTNIDF